MGKILRGMLLEAFIQEYQIEGDSILIRIDPEKQTAYYVIDGEKIIKADYQQMKTWMEKEI